MLTDFALQQAEKSKQLQTFYEQGDLTEYRTAVHALKSTSKTIGARAFSDQARILEMLAKDQDRDGIAKKHPDLMAGYEALSKQIASL